jgi:antitoxin component YwqK of YwqJK toxin-antitoxin module
MKEYTVKVFSNGKQEWFLNDKRHREDGPAVIWPDGRQFWYLNGKLHREDGPAYIGSNGTQAWYLNGKIHREDEFNNRKNSCDGKIVEIDGKKYKLTSIS